MFRGGCSLKLGVVATCALIIAMFSSSILLENQLISTPIFRSVSKQDCNSVDKLVRVPYDCYVPPSIRTQSSAEYIDNTSIQATTPDGVALTLNIPALKHCGTAHLTLTASSSLPITLSQAGVIEDTLGIRLYVHVYTRSDLSGLGCEELEVLSGLEKSGPCVMLRRPLALRVGEDGNTTVLHASFTPDTSSNHYWFTLETWTVSLPETKACVWSPLFRHSNKQSSSNNCIPVLHLASPSSSPSASVTASVSLPASSSPSVSLSSSQSLSPSSSQSESSSASTSMTPSTSLQPTPSSSQSMSTVTQTQPEHDPTTVLDQPDRTLCHLGDDPFVFVASNLTTPLPSVDFTSSLGVTYTVSVNHFQHCYLAQLTLALPESFTGGLSAEPEFSVFMHFYTAKNSSGIACDSSVGCGVRVRELVVRATDDKKAWIASMYPDPSSAHYMFVVKNKGDDASSDKCWNSGVLTPLPTERIHVTKYVEGTRPYGLNPGEPHHCTPVLHLDVPSMHDFYVSVLPTEQGGLTVVNPNNTISRDDPMRLCDSCSLVASYGVNRFVVKYPSLFATLYPDHVKDVTLYGRLLNNDYIVNLNVSYNHDDTLGGYIVEFDLRDPGVFTLQVGVGWYFGSQDPERTPIPVCVSAHRTFRYFAEPDFVRSFIHDGIPIGVSLSPEAVSVGEKQGPSRFGDKKCETGDNPGRWVNMKEKHCEPPYCTGNREATVNAKDRVTWMGRTWIWIPHSCYYHMYDKADVCKCAKQTGLNWLVAMGDSQEREFMSLMLLHNNSMSLREKFAKVDFLVGDCESKPRWTWQFYEVTANSWETFLATDKRAFKYDQQYFDHFNMVPSKTSGSPIASQFLFNTENTRPSVFLINNANAHVAKYSTWENYFQWIHAFVEYIGNEKAITNPERVPDRPEVSKPSRFIWYTAPAVFAQGRDHNIYLTTKRAARQSEYSAQLMRNMGFPIVDANLVTQSRWDVTLDGLHYAENGNTENFYSQVSYMVYEVVLNTLFSTCY